MKNVHIIHFMKITTKKKPKICIFTDLPSLFMQDFPINKFKYLALCREACVLDRVPKGTWSFLLRIFDAQ